MYAAGSEDTDTLTFNAPLLLRHLTARSVWTVHVPDISSLRLLMSSASKKLDIMEIDLSRVLQGLNITMEQFIDICILCGCDYCDSIRGR